MISDLLQSSLTVRLENIAPGMRDTWLPELGEYKIREDMLANPRLHDRILGQICGTRLPARQEPLKVVSQPEKLEFIFANDFSEVILAIGAVWHSNRIAQLVTSGELARVLPDVPLDVVRASLKFRDFGCDASDKYPFAHDDIFQDGALNLATWIDDQPEDVHRRLTCLWDLPQPETDPDLRKLRFVAVDAVLEDRVTP